MDKISINLLPVEVILRQKQNLKVVLVNRLSVSVLLVLAFLTSALLALRISQASQLKKVSSGLALATERVDSLKEREAYAVALKARLDSIRSLSTDSKKATLFNLLISLAPANVSVSNLAVDKTGVLTVSLSAPSADALEVLIASLNNKEKNAGLVSSAELTSLSKGKDGNLRVELKIKTKS